MKKKDEDTEKKRISCPEYLFTSEEAEPEPSGTTLKEILSYSIPIGVSLLLLGFWFFRKKPSLIESGASSPPQLPDKPAPLKTLQQKGFEVAPIVPKAPVEVMGNEDKLFLEKINQLIESHIGDSSFNVEAFREEMGMSKSQFYRKVQALTGKSPGQYLRLARLERALELLQSQSGNVTEVAYQVGFNNLSYFSKCFREHFGKLPSAF